MLALFRVFRGDTQLVLLNLAVDARYKRVHLVVVIFVSSKVHSVHLLFELCHVSIASQVFLILNLSIQEFSIEYLLGFSLPIQGLLD